MTMPRNLVLVRHGQSEANVLQAASKNGDESMYTEEVSTYPDRSWRLTSQGVTQAQVAGDWIQETIGDFNRHITSPYIRTRETAAHLALPGALWEENRVVRERSWGEIDSMSRQQFIRDYPVNAQYKDKDPIYWSPPAGESLASVGESRVHNLLSTLHRENTDDNVLIVTHGEFTWALMMVLERWSDEEFLENDNDPDFKIHNCSVIHYTREDPFINDRYHDEGDWEPEPKLSWVRRAYPQLDEETGQWKMQVSEWREFGRKRLSNEELLAVAETQARYLDNANLPRLLSEKNSRSDKEINLRS